MYRLVLENQQHLRSLLRRLIPHELLHNFIQRESKPSKPVHGEPKVGVPERPRNSKAKAGHRRGHIKILQPVSDPINKILRLPKPNIQIHLGYINIRQPRIILHNDPFPDTAGVTELATAAPEIKKTKNRA